MLVFILCLMIFVVNGVPLPPGEKLNDCSNSQSPDDGSSPKYSNIGFNTNPGQDPCHLENVQQANLEETVPVDGTAPLLFGSSVLAFGAGYAWRDTASPKLGPIAQHAPPPEALSEELWFHGLKNLDKVMAEKVGAQEAAHVTPEIARSWSPEVVRALPDDFLFNLDPKALNAIQEHAAEALSESQIMGLRSELMNGSSRITSLWDGLIREAGKASFDGVELAPWLYRLLP
ncbi:MAG: hypothetical protein M1829_005690 [Trizodia sp. TS-e1964]|nr:MAG: hypothetical protein M1829_005690 [Trizodia sp. TS-e1964]